MASIAEITKLHKFSGTRFHKYADVGGNNNITIDYSGGIKNSVYTSVDCYVSGSYISSNGRTLEIKQRYTVYVSYNRDSQHQAMNDVQRRIVDDFNKNFPDFRVQDIFIPQGKFITPLGNQGLVEDAYFYQGSDLFKSMSRLDVGRFKLSQEKEIYKSNVKNIKRRYGI